ncbi:MAG: V-type ATP synthase subunit E [Candidatus Poribacteria bacterium]
MDSVGSLETLRDQILKQAKEQASAVIEREQRIAEHDLEFAKEDADKIKEQQKARIQSLVDIEKRKILASAEMESRRMLLEKKEELVSNIFAEAETKLEEMRGSKLYIDAVTKSIENAVDNIGDNLIVEFSEKDKSIFIKDLISSIESDISKAVGKNVKLEFRSSGENISAGVIIKSKDGRIIIDNTFSNLIKRLEEDIRGKVSEILLQEK